MKILRLTCCLFVVLLSLVALAFSTTAPRAHAAASGRATVFRLQSKTALAGFDSFSPDGCIETLVSLDATRNGPGWEAGVSINQFDDCTQTPLLFAFGSSLSPDVKVGGNLSSASLSATISVLDRVSGNRFQVLVSQTWTATGPLSREIGSFHFQTKNYIMNSHLNETFRDASTSGTVSIGTTNFTPPHSEFFAQIAWIKFGDVTISRS